MAKTREQVKADALALSDEDRTRLVEELIDASVGELLETDREHIDATLQDRLKGPFTVIDDPKTHFGEQRRRHREALDESHG